MRLNAQIIFITAFSSLFLFIQSSIAQEQDAIEQEDDALLLEEVIVTARFREESLVDAPYSITAITAVDIEAKGINEITDVVSFSPGFFYSESSVGKNSREHRRMIFRGLNPRTDLPHRAAASLFIDGAPSIGPEFGDVQNIERIEVLKGPQAARFGRSTYVGAINVITKDPAKEFGGRVAADVGSFSTYRISAAIDIPFGDKFRTRVTASTYETDGMYDNAQVPGEKLGARSTDDVSLTLLFEPSDSFDLKVRYHVWEDSDGPDAATLFDHRLGSGGEHHNCAPGGTWQRYMEFSSLSDLGFSSPLVPATWICGRVPSPTNAQIGQDTGSARAHEMRRNAATDFGLMPNALVPDHFGLEREAEEISAVANINFDNGMNLNMIAAAHEDIYATMNDLDRRATEGLYLQGLGGDMFGGFGANHPADSQDLRMSALEDSSFEIRLSSASDKRLRWSVGYSDTSIDFSTQTIGSLIVYFPADDVDNATAPFPVNYNPFWFFTPGNTVSDSNINQAFGRTTSGGGVVWADVNTSAVYGSVAFDFNDKFTASVEARYQEDDITEGNYGYVGGAGSQGPVNELLPRDEGTSGTFKSTSPRVILDYKPSDNSTWYISYSEGTLPGLFNASLAGLSDAELDQVKTQTNGAGVEVDEEESENIELGVKTSFAGGRGYLSVSYYQTDISNLHTPIFAVSYTDDDGVPQTISGSIVGQGASAELNGIEIEGAYLLNENWGLEWTYAYNDSEIGKGFDSADAYDLTGDETGADGNSFSRYPKNSGSFSVNYNQSLNSGHGLFARADLIYTGKMYASQANLAHTGDGTKLNLGIGVNSDRYTVELYCRNCTDDDQPKGLQALFDFSGISGAFGDRAAGIGGARGLSVALADKREIGLRASYNF